MGRYGWGALYTFTLGLLGLGWLVDAFRIPSLVRNTNAKIREQRHVLIQKRVCDGYALAISPLGILGMQHFYLGRYGIGTYYFLTLGGFGIGWIADWFRMKWLVERVNEEYRDPRQFKG